MNFSQQSLSVMTGLALVLTGCATVNESVPAPSFNDQTEPEHAWLAAYAALQRLEELGNAAAAAGDHHLAARYFSKAAEYAARVPSPTGDWLRVKAAVALLKAKQPEQAISELNMAVQDGFRFDKHLKRSSDFGSVTKRADFQKLLRAASSNAKEFAETHGKVEDAKLEFGDVQRFWAAYDSAKKAKGMAAKAATFRREYLAPGSPGLIDYHHIKIQSMENLVTTIQGATGYYDGIRDRTLGAHSLAPLIRAGLARLALLYPEATFPDVTFVVGRMNSGGTAGPSGMLIGLDIWSWKEGVPLDGVSVGMQTLLKSSSLEQLPWVVLHEHVHALQVFAREETLLDAALAEGSADFIASLALPDSDKPYYYQWGIKHEERVWKEFQTEMNGSDTSRWIANQNHTGKNWSADLGYFIGARICEAYYARATNKGQAIKDLLFVESSEAILQKSGYGNATHLAVPVMKRGG